MQQLISSHLQSFARPIHTGIGGVYARTRVCMTSAACAARASLAHHDQRQGHICTAFDSLNRHANLGSHKRAGK